MVPMPTLPRMALKLPISTKALGYRLCSDMGSPIRRRCGSYWRWPREATEPRESAIDRASGSSLIPCVLPATDSARATGRSP